MIVMQARVIDPTHLELAEPIQAPTGERVLVSVREPGDDDDARESWLLLSAEGLQRAYGDTEPEYSINMVRERNPEYTG